MKLHHLQSSWAAGAQTSHTSPQTAIDPNRSHWLRLLPQRPTGVDRKGTELHSLTYNHLVLLPVPMMCSSCHSPCKVTTPEAVYTCAVSPPKFKLLDRLLTLPLNLCAHRISGQEPRLCKPTLVSRPDPEWGPLGKRVI